MAFKFLNINLLKISNQFTSTNKEFEKLRIDVHCLSTEKSFLNIIFQNFALQNLANAAHAIPPIPKYQGFLTLTSTDPEILVKLLIEVTIQT